MVKKIKPLDPSVVNKIAAGEIIISPVNALKEMMENSIDAGASSIDILVRDGGIKLLQITDNGSGIDKGDLPILCQRFTTSKLSKFEDLESIATYGFRGEALASISHIARLTITTKTRNDKCAWRATYSEGKMNGNPAPVAGKEGTVILVENLFYNMPSRLRALRSPSEEYGKILDVTGRYACHSQGIAFSCKKSGDSQFALTVRANLSIEERIRTVFGNNVSSNLISLQIEKLEDLRVVHVVGKMSNLDFSFKKSITPIFFINNRLVVCNTLARALRQVYANYLPKGDKPFIYLSISMHPETLDVNIHPTKREVRFLHEEEIIEVLSSKLNEELSNIDSSRSFKTSSILTKQPLRENSEGIRSSVNNGNVQKPLHTLGHGKMSPYRSNLKVNENKLVRTDASQSKITSFMGNHSDLATTNVRQPISPEEESLVANSQLSSSYNPDSTMKVNSLSPSTLSTRNQTYTFIPRERAEVNLTSIKRLREAVDNSAHKDLTDIFANLTYVGVIDEERRLAAIQHDLKLFLIDYGAVCYEFFYQICLTDFANFGIIKLHCENRESLKLVDLLSNFQNVDKESSRSIIDKIWEMKDMLNEYFSINIAGSGEEEKGNDHFENVCITGLPLLLKGYAPPLNKLPFFIYRLGTKVNWEEEQPCLDGIMRQIALLHIPEIIETIDLGKEDIPEEEKVAYSDKKEELSAMLDNVIFPCIKRRFLAPRELAKDIVEIANLPGLYRVFERC
ncbi:related to DNA mismatch repair protein MLH1 [Zygosaccharomyces bailii]|nr:related to DNA mismatch repair protein MLH1 [Zygosaccharomyces bailii]